MSARVAELEAQGFRVRAWRATRLAARQCSRRCSLHFMQRVIVPVADGWVVMARAIPLERAQ